MPYAFVNGINMYYEMKGEGFPLMALPGMGSSLEIWSPEYRNFYKPNTVSVNGLSRHRTSDARI